MSREGMFMSSESLVVVLLSFINVLYTTAILLSIMEEEEWVLVWLKQLVVLTFVTTYT